MTALSFNELRFEPARHGIAARPKYPNGYSASVIQSEFSYGGENGLYEIAVLHGGQIVYDTPVTEDVLGYLNEDDVTAVLRQIAELPAREVSA